MPNDPCPDCAALAEARTDILEVSGEVRALAEEQASKMPSRSMWSDKVRLFEASIDAARAALARHTKGADRG